MSDRDQEILEEIKGHLAGRGVEVGGVTPEARISEDLDLDSLDTVELTLGLEKRFGVEISDEEAEELSTVGDVVALIGTKLGSVGV